jgi:hypothetical protein
VTTFACSNQRGGAVNRSNTNQPPLICSQQRLRNCYMAYGVDASFTWSNGKWMDTFTLTLTLTLTLTPRS